MNSTKVTFESQNLIVDYLSLKFQELEDPNLEKIAKYLFQIGFNSYQESGKLVKPVKSTSFENKFEVYFVEDNSY